MNDYLPKDILKYVLDEKLEADFLTSIMLHKQNYSIAEIADRQLWTVEGRCYIKSDSYGLNVEVPDQEIVDAIRNRLYVSVFLSKKDDNRQLHFFVHKCLIEEKASNEEQIAEEVVQYMLLKTIVSLRLDTPEKVREYCQTSTK